MSMLKLGVRLDEGGWLPLSLTEFGHWPGFIVSPDDGAVSIRRPRRKNKKREILWGPQMGEKGEGVRRAHGAAREVRRHRA